MAFDVKKPFNKDAHFAALKAAAQASKAEPPSVNEALKRPQNLLEAKDCAERMRIVFDDSGSMDGEKIENAKAGVVEYLRSCTPGQTAVAIHLLNGKDYYSTFNNPSRKLPAILEDATITSDLILLASAASDDSLQATGSTPLESTLLDAIQAKPRATRIIAFSDGQPDSKSNTERIISLCKEQSIPIDAVYLEDERSEDVWAREASSSAIAYMRNLAERTGGIFLHFKKGTSFKEGFKYLAAGKRFMLMDKSFKEKVERGEI